MASKSTNKRGGKEAVLAAVARAEAEIDEDGVAGAEAEEAPASPKGNAGGGITIAGKTPPIAADPENPDEKVVEFCAVLDQSDTDNAIRLIAHFGRDLRVLSQEKAKAPFYVVWTGTHWDTGTGNPRALAMAQRVGDRIKREIFFITPSKVQAKLLEEVEPILQQPSSNWSAADKDLVKQAEAAKAGLAGRRKSRKDFAVTSCNIGRVENMLKAAGPHLMTAPDAFNADPMKTALRGHTLRFEAWRDTEVNPEAEREDAPEGTPAHITVRRSRVVVTKGHRREDLITELVPVDYKPKAVATEWLAFLEEYLPDPAVRRMVQVAAGLGLVGATVQQLFFHYGAGANGKSVFMEVICRVLGQAAVTLPSSSFFGSSGQGGGATPDIARLYGRRWLRVKELPQGEDLREELVKELTGGELISVRDLYAGYFDFKPIFTAHMSGNNYPKITGTDNGIWRRMAVILWPKTIPEEKRRDFEDVVSGFEPEHPGILNWLIEGVLIYLREGLVVPEAVTAETKKYRAEMDPTSGFVTACVREVPDGEVAAREFYNGYVAWCGANGSKPISETAFGRIMGKKFTREDGRVRKYVGIMLFDVPESPSVERYPEGYGGSTG